jgi:DNA protecting protein DprA
MDATPLSAPVAERDALLALWAVPGVGAVGLGQVRRWADGRWADLLATPVRDWVDTVPLADAVRERMRGLRSLQAVAEAVRERAARGQMRVVHPGDAGYPERLAEVADAPPVLFFRGRVGAARRRLALVGTRHPEQGFLRRAREFASVVSLRGAGVVSGAAAGVDRACHLGALDVGGETWAFLGSALDAIDAAQERLVPAILDAGGAVYSELPPGIRASRQTFPRRNRLISGSADAVVVLRAGDHSGAMHTVHAARKQGRPILAWPGEVWAEAARGCNLLLLHGIASPCLSAEDALRAVGLLAAAPPPPPEEVPLLSPGARGVYALLTRTPRALEELEVDSGLDPGALMSALCELELLGLAFQSPGKRYERV